MHLCIGANVQLTLNYLNVGLSNGSTGIVKEMFYDENHVEPELIRLVFADFGI